jgi:hypothetical protein
MFANRAENGGYNIYVIRGYSIDLELSILPEYLNSVLVIQSLPFNKSSLTLSPHTERLYNVLISYFCPPK